MIHPKRSRFISKISARKTFFVSVLFITGFTIIFLASGFFTSLAYAAPAVIYVDSFYIMNNAEGHVFGIDAFSKIQEGVNAVASGGMVQIAAGTYNEQVVINSKSLTLKGAGDTTIIKPSGADTLTFFYAYLDNAPQFPGMKAAGIIMVRDVGTAGIAIQDLRLDGSNVIALPAGAERLSGIFYAESAGNIKNVTVNAIRTNGIDDRTYGMDINAINSPISVEIIGNRVTNYLSNGIRAVGRNLTIDIHDNAIVGPDNLPQTSLRTTNGIGLVYGPGGRVSGNVIRHLHSSNDGWSSSGIIVYGDNFKPLTVEGNEVFDVDYGISVSNGANDVVIRNNYLHDNKTGVMLESRATNNMIVSNIITKNIQGFQIHGSLSSNPTGNKPPGSGNAAHENLISENTYGVISFDDTQLLDVRHNWWGSADPDFSKIISGSVNYIPWWVTKEGASLEAPKSVVPAALESKVAPVSPIEPESKLEALPMSPPVETTEELPKVDESLPQGGEGVVARAIPEEQTALFDVGVGPGEQQESKKRITTAGANLVTRIAPGELLPISVKLVNFGGGKRVDVIIDYFILNEKGDVVLTEKETVAVETTASFIKIFQIPRDIPSGKYTAESGITYQGQKVPATASYQFVVERKIAGMFVSQFLIYGSVVIIALILGVVASRLIKKKLRAGRLTPHEYPEVPQKERIFYEIISDIIMQMRYRVGDKAVDIAKNIDDLVIDELNGKVLSIKKSPAKIITLLILKYEKMLGEKISFAFPKADDKTKDHLASVEKNLVVIRKYFE